MKNKGARVRSRTPMRRTAASSPSSPVAAAGPRRHGYSPRLYFRGGMRILRSLWDHPYINTVIVVVALYFMYARTVVEYVPTGLRLEESNRPGRLFNKSQVTIRRPVVMIPGLFCSALELWEGKECVRSDVAPLFRQRWFSPFMMMTILRDPECWLEHVALDRNVSVNDPEGIRMRVVPCIDSSDYLSGGIWIWAKVIFNLVDIGYDPKLIHMASFDWRLTPSDLEVRDRYMTTLQRQIELMHDLHGEKILLLGYSYGTNVAVAFLQWVDVQSPGWIDRHVHSFVNVAGSTMGVPKLLAPLISGEVLETAAVWLGQKLLVDTHAAPASRRDALRTWGGFWALQLRGNDAMWSSVLMFNNRNISASESISILREEATKTGHWAMHKYFSEYRLDELPQIPRTSSLKVYCMYGIGLDSVAGYIYDTETMTVDSNAPNKGVYFGDGDGVVPLMSLGYMCRSQKNGWSNAAEVTTIEIKKRGTPVYIDPREGSEAANHLHILGNYGVIKSILQLATGNEHLIRENVESDIDARIARFE